MRMRFMGHIVVVIGIVLSVLDSATSFLRPTFIQRSDLLFNRNALQMSDRNGMMSSRGGGRGSGGRGRGDGTKGKPLDQREGSRALTRAELKAKEIYDATKEPDVVRLHAPEDRVALSLLTVGQKLRGRIISLKEFGMFVDIGSKRDGLVHVKDISKDYFINNHQSKFVPGQDIDVWVKFVEEDSYKLGLQMFPVLDRQVISRNPATVNLSDISELDEVEGKVVRVSNYGVFIDIGAGVDAFLHRRKMKLNKKSMILKPWEVAPLGSTVKAYVHEVDARRKRIGLTTYAPEQWNDMLPMKSDTDRPMIEDMEELGGSAMADNFRALERTLSLNLADREGILEGEDDEDSDDEGDDDDDDDDGEDLTAEEVRALTSGRRQQPQILIDDFGGKASAGVSDDKSKGKGRGYANGPSAGAGVTKSDAQQNAERKRREVINDGGEMVDMEELFRELCVRGRDYITVKDFKKYQYMQMLAEEYDITDSVLTELFSEAGAVQGKLVEEQFEGFMDILTDHCGLEEPGGDYDSGITGEDEEGEEENVEESVEDVVLMNDFAEGTSVSTKSMNRAARRAKAVEDEEMPDDMAAEDMNNDYDDELNFGLGSTKLGTGPTTELVDGKEPSLSLSDHYEKKSKTNDLFQYVFSSVAGKKGHVTFDDVLNWDFTQAILVQGQSSKEKVKGMFTKCRPVDGKLGISEFEKLVEMLSETEKQTKAQVNAQFGVDIDEEEEDEVEVVVKKGKAKKEVQREGVVNLTPESDRTDFIAMKPKDVKPVVTEDEDEDDMEEEEEEMTIDEVFSQLANGMKTVTYEALAEWDVIDELVEESPLTLKILKALFMQAGGKKKAVQGGSSLTLSLEGFEELLDLLAPYGDDGEEEEDFMPESAVIVQPPKSKAKNAVSKVEPVPSSVSKNTKETPTDKKEVKKNVAEKTDEKVEDEEELDDEELLKNVFQSLAGDKSFVTAKDLMNWDIVLELMGEGLLDDDILKEKMAECEGYNGKGVGISGFDQLVDKLVGLYGEEEGEENEEDIEIDGEEMADEEGDDEGIEIDIEEAFKTLTKGKKTISLADFKEWFTSSGLMDAFPCTDGELKEMAKDAGAKDEKKINYKQFESMMNEFVVEENEEEEDDDEEDEDEDEDEEDDKSFEIKEEYLKKMGK